MVKVLVDEFGDVEADLRPEGQKQKVGVKYKPTQPSSTKKTERDPKPQIWLRR